MKKYWRILGTAALVALLLWRIDWAQVGAAFGHLNVWLWAAALGTYLFAQTVSVVRWYLLARMLGLGGSAWQYLSYYFTGMFFNLVLPTSVGGDMVRVWYLCRQPGPIPTSGRRTAALVSVLADRANGLAVLVVMASLAALLCPVPLPGWTLGSVLGMAAATLGGLVLMPFLPRLQQYLPANPRLQRLLQGATRCWQARGVMVAVTVLSVVVQGANIVLGWLLGQAIGLPVPALYYGVLISLVSLLTMLPISVNGMGVREASTVLLLAPLGVGSAQAVTLSLLLFTVYTSASLAGCGFYLFGRLPRFQARAAGADTEASDHAESVRDHSHQGRAGQPPAAA